MLYLDNAATTPVRPEVLEAMAPYLMRSFGNPASHHGVGADAARAVEDARARVAAVLGMRAGDVTFTSGGTESNNLAVKGIGVAALLNRGAHHVVTSPIEHESVLACVDFLTRAHGFSVSYVPVDSDGVVDPAAVADAVRPDTALVSIGYANNEIGTVQNLAQIAAAVNGGGNERHVPLHTDAVQAVGWLPISAAALGVDALSIAGHKIGTPKGLGVLAARGRIPVEPVLHGGGQQRGRRAGTENVAGAVALATALEMAERDRAANSARVAAIRDQFIQRILTQVPQAKLTGHATQRLPGSASFTFVGTSGEAVLIELERRGILSSSGSACAAGSTEASHVLVAAGMDDDTARSAVRFTLSPLFTGSLDDAADAVAASVAAVQSGT